MAELQPTAKTLRPGGDKPSRQTQASYSLPNSNDQLVMALLLIGALALGLLVVAIRGTGVDIDAHRAVPVQFRVHANTACWQEFSLIPGIGEKLAKRIVDSRCTNGPFSSLEQLQRVRGIGPQLQLRLAEYVVLDGAAARDPQMDSPRRGLANAKPLINE